MALNELAAFPAIKTGAINQGTTTSEQTTFVSSFVALTDTVSSLPGNGDYFANISSGVFGFSTPQSNKIGINTTGTNVSGGNLQAFLENLDTQVETNKNNIDPNADPTTTSTVEATGALMDSDFGSNGIMRRTGSGAYDTIDNGIDQLTSSEASQLQNIGSLNIDSTNWSVVSGLDQSLATSSDVEFSTVNDLSLAEQSTAFTISGGSDTARTLTMDADLTASDVMSGLSNDPDPVLGGDLGIDGNSFIDTNDNTLLSFNEASNAVNYLELGNANTGNDLTLAAQGSDTHVGIDVQTMGDGNFSLNGTAITQSTWDNVAEINQDLSTDESVEFADVSLSNGVVYNTLGENMQIKRLVISDSAQTPITDVDAEAKMVVMIIDKTGSDQFAMFYLDGSNNSATEIHALTANWGTSLGSQTQNVFHDGGSSYVLENTSSGIKEYAVQIFAAD